MQQPELILIANHQMGWSPKIDFGNIFHIETIAPFINNYANAYYQLTNNIISTKYNFAQPQKKDDGSWIYHLCGIDIRLQKNIIQWNFPFIFRAMIDFKPLQYAVFQLVSTSLFPLKSTDWAIFPSFWIYKTITIRNQWQKERLEKMQTKIVYESVSFKRSLLNLEHCLGKPSKAISDIAQNQYKSWWKHSIGDTLDIISN